MIFNCEVSLQQLRKAKYSILASTSHIFHKTFLTEPYTYLYNALCKSHDFLIVLRIWTHFSKNATF